MNLFRFGKIGVLQSGFECCSAVIVRTNDSDRIAWFEMVDGWHSVVDGAYSPAAWRQPSGATACWCWMWQGLSCMSHGQDEGLISVG